MVIRDIIFSITPPALHNVLWIKAGDNNTNDLYVYNGGWRKIGTSSGETLDYNDLENKPRIDNVVLEGNLTLQELGIILPDLSKYVTEEALSKTLETYAKKSDIPDISNLVTESELSSAISEQEFKTINGQEITGEGNIEISGGLNYHEIPELTEDYMVTSNPSLTNEEVYYIKIGATVHAVTGDSTIKWQDGRSPVSEANSTMVVRVLNNLAVWGIFK